MQQTSLAATTPPAEEKEEGPVLRRDDDYRGTFSVAFENDVFAGEDNGYTNGIRFAWLSPETDVPDWIEKAAHTFPFFAEEGRKRYSLALGQTMYAPDDLTQPNLIIDDRPYAGYTYASVGMLTDTGFQLDNLQLTVGIVGPSALAEQTQDFVHHTLGSTDPQGWDNQLNDELGLMLTYERKWRSIYELSPFGLGVDMTPHFGGSVGNVHTYLSTGATFRVGYDLPADYGPPLIRPNLPGSDFFVPNKTFGWYLFAGFEGRAVARNIFLDGNTFSDSHSVDKKVFIGGVQAGIAMNYKNTRIAYTHVFRTREFDQQAHADEYGAITLSYRF